jgi:hypothetical protein
MRPSGSLIPECHSKSGEIMDIKTPLESLRFILLLGLLSLGSILGLAQTKAAPTKQLPPSAGVGQTSQGPRVPPYTGKQKTITDAAGRSHVRHERITFAQRKAAAQHRVQAMRQAAAKQRQAEVKK